MRRAPLTISVLAAAAALAALAAGASPASGATSDRADRVFYILDPITVRALWGDEAGVDEDAPEESDGLPYDDDPADNLPETEVSIPETEWGQLDVLARSGLASGATSLEDALYDLELPFAFAGREQWVRNLSGGGVADEPRLQDVSMESVVTDPGARRMLLGRAAAMAERGLSAADDLAYWKTLVPSWAYRVRDELAKKGIPFSVELLASPEINIMDTSKPLFGKRDAPVSLFGLGVFQGGERAFLRSLGADELMLEVWPAYYRYYHRPAGAPVPSDLLAGLTFGSPVRLEGNTYLFSPLMSTEPYLRWQAYGYPGDPTYERDTSYKPGAYDPTGFGQEWYFRGRLAPFAPSSLAEDDLKRFEILMAEG